MPFKITLFFMLCAVYHSRVKCLTKINNTHNNEIVEIITQNRDNLSLSGITENTQTNPRVAVKIENNKNKLFSSDRKNKKRTLQEQILANTDFLAIDNSYSKVNTTSRTNKKKRRRKKKKKKQNVNNILEVTTAKGLLNSSIVLNNNSDVNSLIKRLNNNPGDSINLEEIEKTIKVLNSNNTNTLSVKIKIKQNKARPNDNVSKTRKKNRCKKNNGGCSQICKRKGKVKCSCLRGYVLAKNRKKCVDINECKFNNGGCKHACKNILGGYYCECPGGFRVSDDLKSCQDINECYLRNGHGPCQDTCTNTYGSYICDCSHLNGTRLAGNQHSCEDINECEEETSGCTHLCINTIGGVFCSCPKGMELMSDYKTCQDINECEDISVKKSCKSECINTIGSYYCENDFQNDQYLNETRIPVCPPLNPPEHGFITCLTNTSLLYKNGRKIVKNIPGTKCHLICPIGFKLIGSSRYICGIYGKWLIEKKGFCIKASYPKLECPPNQVVSLEPGQFKIPVHFSPPQTNVRWQMVNSYPEWAKNFKGVLEEGHHNIQFSITDPATKLSSICSFSIVVKKQAL